MKKVFVLFVFMLSCTSLMAQSGHKGIDFNVDLGYNLFTKGEAADDFSGTLTFGKRFSQNFFAGAGSGVYMRGLPDKISGKDPSPKTFVPIFGDLRYYIPLSSTGITPYMGLKGGYVINCVSSSGSDIYIFQITPGVAFPLSRSVDLNVAAGYEHCMYTQKGVDSDGMIVFRLGISFHKKTSK